MTEKCRPITSASVNRKMRVASSFQLVMNVGGGGGRGGRGHGETEGATKTRAGDEAVEVVLLFFGEGGLIDGGHDGCQSKYRALPALGRAVGIFWPIILELGGIYGMGRWKTSAWQSPLLNLALSHYPMPARILRTEAGKRLSFPVDKIMDLMGLMKQNHERAYFDAMTNRDIWTHSLKIRTAACYI